MCIHPHYPVTWIRRVRLPFATLYGSAGRFKSYLPDLLSRELSQPAGLPLWRRIIAYSSFSLPFRKLYHKRKFRILSRISHRKAGKEHAIRNAIRRFLLVTAAIGKFSCRHGLWLVSHVKKYSLHKETVTYTDINGGRPTPVQDHVEEVSSFLLRRKNDDH